MPTKDELKVQFHAIRKEIEAEQTAIDALRKDYDAKVEAARKRVAPLLDEIRKLEEPIYKKKMDLSAIAKQLRGPDGIVDTALPEHTLDRSN